MNLIIFSIILIYWIVTFVEGLYTAKQLKNNLAIYMRVMWAQKEEKDSGKHFFKVQEGHSYVIVDWDMDSLNYVVTTSGKSITKVDLVELLRVISLNTALEHVKEMEAQTSIKILRA